jgi:hypothetical protein
MKNGRSSKEISTWYQDHTSKIINTKSKSIRPNRIRFNSHVRPYRVLRCGQLEVSRTCRFDVGTSIFLFDNSMPNITGTSSAGVSVQLITYDYCPSGPPKWKATTSHNFNSLSEHSSSSHIGASLTTTTMSIISPTASTTNGKQHAHLLREYYGIDGGTPEQQDSPTTLLSWQFDGAQSLFEVSARLADGKKY